MIFSKARAAALAAVLLFTVPARAAEHSETQSFTLTNGMQVVLLESHRVPAVTHMLWYRVGGADDFTGRSGLAHYNEHMMFQGTAKVPSGKFVATVNGYGGHLNAFTSRDYTAFYVSIAKEHLPQIMEMEADRMLHLAPTEANFLKEREVIIEERRMNYENRPEALLSEEMQAALFRNHPYHTPVIGWMHEMEALSREDVLSFHNQFYHPANAVLVVAGDITRGELEPLAEKYYGSLPAGEKYIRHWRSEPPQRGPRTVTLASRDARQPEWMRIYVAPSVNTEGKELVMPVFVLAQVLGGGETSRLYQSLVMRQKIATNVEADYDGISVGPGQFELIVIPAPGVSMQQIEAAVNAEIAAMANAAPAQPDLARAKLLLKADTIFSRDGLEGLARTLGSLVMAGLSPDYYSHWSDLIDHVNAEDVRHAAESIFDERKSVTGYLLAAPASPEKH